MKFRTQLRVLRARAQGLSTLQVWLFALIIGLSVGYVVIGFRLAIDWVSLIAFGATEETLATGASSLSFLRAWIAPVIGGLLVSIILYFADKSNWLKDGTRPDGFRVPFPVEGPGGGCANDGCSDRWFRSNVLSTPGSASGTV